MNSIKRILGMKNNADDVVAESSLREELLEDQQFKEYVSAISLERGMDDCELTDVEIETLYEVWSSHKNKGTGISNLTAIGIGVIGALALVSPKAEASLGSQIASQIVKTIEPFVSRLLQVVMSTIGMDIANSSDKVAAAAGKGVDAQNEVLKTIYNKEASRAAEPAPNECLSQEAAKRASAGEEQTQVTLNDMVVRDQEGLIYIRHSIIRATGRMSARRKMLDETMYKGAGVSPAAPPSERVAAMTKAASVTTFNGSRNLDSAAKAKAEGHVAALFKDTAPSIDLHLEVDSPSGRAHLDQQVESEATLNHCINVFKRDIAERTGTQDKPSFRAAIAEKVASEYGAEGFIEEIRGKTHSVPLLKTLIEQQSFANMMAVKSYEQQSELLKLQALQLKEAVKLSIS